jgi:regulatory protein
VAGTITALRFQKRNQDRVNVHLDGKYAFGLDAMEAARLSKGQILSDSEIVALKTRDEYQVALGRAIRFLGYRPRSRAEVERYLRGKGVAEEVSASVLLRLEQLGYLDDEEFARFWVDNRREFKPRGQRALAYELRQKGVSSQIIADVIDGVDDREAAWKAIENRLRHWERLNYQELRSKLVGFLQRRGFSYEVINYTLKRACQSLDIEG